MSNFIEISDELEKQFNDIRTKQTSLPDFVTIKLLNNPKQKDIFKVFKASKIVTYLNQIDALVFINEDLYNMLDEESQSILLEEALAYISYDSEKDVTNITTPDVVSFSGLISKYNEKFFRYHELVKMLIQQKEDDKSSKKPKK